jgi:hypothetical protein
MPTCPHAPRGRGRRSCSRTRTDLNEFSLRTTTLTIKTKRDHDNGSTNATNGAEDGITTNRQGRRGRETSFARRETHPWAPFLLKARRRLRSLRWEVRPRWGVPFISAAMYARVFYGWMDGGCASHVGAGWSTWSHGLGACET